MKRIAVDASKLASSRKTGVELAIESLIWNVVIADKENHYLLYTPAPLPQTIRRQPNVTEVVIPARRFWGTLSLSWRLFRDKPNIFWQPGNILPFFIPWGTRVVATIHDLAFLALPEAYSIKSWLGSYFTCLGAIMRASRIAAVSEFTRQDLVQRFGISPKKVVAIPNSLIPNSAKPKTVQGIPERYVVFIGRIEFRKNIVRLLEAFAEFKQTDKQQTSLVLVGSPGYGYKQILETMGRLNIHPFVLVTGYLSDEEIAAVRQNAIALVHPSLYEGFGLTILEGYHDGVPVMTSNITAMKEVAGDAAILVDPMNIEEMAAGLKTLSEDKERCVKLVRAGKERAKAYSWATSAAEYVKIFNSL